MKQDTRFGSHRFAQRYHYDGFLGVCRSSRQTEFRLWAPTAEQVTLHCYSDGTGDTELFSKALERGKRGTWFLLYPADLNGVYYDYSVTVAGVTMLTADPYARACGLNGNRSMVLDLSETNPEGWEQDTPPEKQNEDIIYEVHVKDFTYDPASGVCPQRRGKYIGAAEENTTLNGDGKHPTGLAYLKTLGVTHVQLMPVFDFGSVDEAGGENQYNWGYDPVNYNIPEGSYSSDPASGPVRIRELKQMILSLHRSGFRVIMDVVYNHTYHLDSWLWRTVPGYFYRMDDNGKSSNGSGCGNVLASERSMCARYILDSVLYWAEEYHMDGFRFDLMGLMDAPLINRIQTALDARYGGGEKLLFGEPWTGGQTWEQRGTVLADKAHFRAMNERIGAFCDKTRDAIKGSLMSERAGGFVNGGGIWAPRFGECLKGWSGPHEEYTAPSQTITYVSSHDDWTLWDKLVLTMSWNRQFDSYDPGILRANRLAAAIYACCQGHLFLLAGEEFGRTKYGRKNSYNASPAINCLDWSRAWKNKALTDFYRGLIALRKQLPGLYDKSPEARKRVKYVQDISENCVCALLDNSGDSRWSELLLAFSARDEEISFSLPDGTWECLVDAESSFVWREPRRYYGMASVASLSAIIFGRVKTN